MRIIFMGSPEFAVGALNLLLKSKNEIIAVYAKAPKPSGRGQKLTKSPVHVIAEENNIGVCTPVSLKSLVEQEKFRNFKPEVAVVAAYGLVLPKKILDIPKYGCINIHPSLLPRWRGAAPIQHSILAGDQETGVSIMQLNEGLDSGPILKQKKLLIEKNDNYKTLHDKLSELGSDLLMEVLNEIEKHLPLEQNDDNACYANKIEDYKIYAGDACEAAYRKVKAFYPKAFIKIENKRVRILDADCQANTPLNFKQGEITNDNMCINLKDGTLIPKVVQMEGRNPCSIEDFIRGLKFSMVKKFIE
ncbi:methionyl-tRNA formyltransferase [Candidatus Wolbachia massiliensis]|uniref:Methionyl-tRNA formyltransferase n=1 Tax=Candidatus Wolbachia massiliensis TaxID=1845000 RepID=A0A7L7YKW3_9RICK|nr:methionyl-tRNA formyltransferase [Candidatus Wolbachia massiliensis]QOD37864.1 methionyl-tRNA formyltransferase [Candidatus Wolbachia massiliensis]